jgi:hypothetical protein
MSLSITARVMSLPPPPLPSPTNTAPDRLIPGWLIYTCAALIVLPSYLGGTFCYLFLLPKLEAFQETIGSVSERDSRITGMWNSVTGALTMGGQLLLPALTIVLTFLELRVPGWKRRRHWVVLGGASLVNMVFVAAVLLMAISMSLLGPEAGKKWSDKKHMEAAQRR